MKKNGTLKVKKRDGSVAIFNPEKINIAIQKSMRSVGQLSKETAEQITEDIVDEIYKEYFDKHQLPDVENIQDLVEKHLILNKLVDVAKSYILYRDLHSRMRNIDNLLDVVGQINSYLNKKDWKIHFDSEIDYHLQGLYKNISNAVSEKYWMNEVYDEEMKNLHYNKDIHIHKSSAISAYCVGWDLEDLLLSGYKGVKENVTAGPAQHLHSALGQLMNFMYTLTNEAPDGAVAISSLDTYMAPFIRHDNLDFAETKRRITSFIYNMNMPTKSGGQVVFSNITLDLKCPTHMKDQPVIIGGKPQKEKYGDFQKEMDMFNKALSEVYVKGDTKGRAFTFPIPTYNITKDFDWNNENYNGLWEMTAKYGIPYFANFVNSDMNPEDARSMCCRLRIDNRQLQKRGGGLFGANPLTGSIGYVTINLPRIAYMHKGDKTAFLKRLEYLMNESHKILETRRNLIEDLTEKGLYPYSKFYLRSVKAKSGKYWSNHFNTIGIIGMNEACLNFFGKDISDTEGKKFALEVLDYMNDKILEYQKESGTLYNIEATPGEGSCYSLAKKDRQLYPDIIVANQKECQNGAEPYYTNSTHLPVGYTDDIFEALDHQDELQCKYTGGTVLHGFLGERISANEARALVKKITSKYKLPYFTLTPTFSICDSHGYLSGKEEKCPKCGSECTVFSRVVGKIAPIKRWNKGKKSEFKQRKVYCPTP